MSAIVFSGAAQFATLAVLSAGGSVITAIVAATLIASRFLAIGVALGPSMRGSTVRRALEGQAVVDASLILARTGEGRYGVKRLLGATLPQYVGWTLGDDRGRAGGRRASRTRRSSGSTRSSRPSSSCWCGASWATARARVTAAVGDPDRGRADPDRAAGDPGRRGIAGGAGGAGGAAMKHDVWIAIGGADGRLLRDQGGRAGGARRARPAALGGPADRADARRAAARARGGADVRATARRWCSTRGRPGSPRRLVALWRCAAACSSCCLAAARDRRRGCGRSAGARSSVLPVRDPLVLVADARLEGEERPARPAAVVERADRLVAREPLAVGGQLGGGHPRGVGAEEELQQRRVAQLGGVAGRLGAPRVERLAAGVGDAEHAPPPPAALAPLLRRARPSRAAPARRRARNAAPTRSCRRCPRRGP